MNWKPYSAPRKQPNINDMIYPKGEKGPGNVWVGGILMNVQKDDGTPTPPPVPTVPSVQLVSSATSVADASSFTFNSQSIGSGGGAICVAVISNGGNSARAMTSATLNGNAANNYGKAGSGAGAANPSVGLIWLTVTGTSTCNVVVNFSGLMNGCQIYTYRLSNLNGNEPLFLGEATSSNNTTIQISQGGVPANSLGVMVGAAGDTTPPSTTLTLTNATADATYDSNYGTVGIVGTFDETSAGTLTMNLNSTDSVALVALNLIYN